MWHHWRGDIAAAIIGLLCSPVLLYALGAVAVAASATLRCEDQCEMDRLYSTVAPARW